MYTANIRDAVRAFQTSAGLPTTGTVDAQTWDTLYEQYATIEREVFSQEVLFPNTTSYENTTRMEQFPGETIQPGTIDGGT